MRQWVTNSVIGHIVWVESGQCDLVFIGWSKEDPTGADEKGTGIMAC